MKKNDTIIDKPKSQKNSSLFISLNWAKLGILAALILLPSIIASLIFVNYISNDIENNQKEIDCVWGELSYINEKIPPMDSVDKATYQNLQISHNQLQQKNYDLEKKQKKSGQEKQLLLIKAHKLYYYHNIINELNSLLAELDSLTIPKVAIKMDALNKLINKAEEHGGNLPKTSEKLLDFQLAMIQGINEKNEKKATSQKNKAKKILQERITILEDTIANINLPDID